MGVAWNNGDPYFYVTTFVGGFREQLEFLKTLKPTELYVEELNFFRNAKTVRSLLLRTGFIAYSLVENPVFVRTSVPRKYLGCKNKQDVFNYLKAFGARNTDESDAMALILYVTNKEPGVEWIHI